MKSLPNGRLSFFQKRLVLRLYPVFQLLYAVLCPGEIRLDLILCYFIAIDAVNGHVDHILVGGITVAKVADTAGIDKRPLEPRNGQGHKLFLHDFHLNFQHNI